MVVLTISCLNNYLPSQDALDNNIMQVRWIPDYYGGACQTFQARDCEYDQTTPVKINTYHEDNQGHATSGRRDGGSSSNWWYFGEYLNTNYRPYSATSTTTSTSGWQTWYFVENDVTDSQKVTTR